MGAATLVYVVDDYAVIHYDHVLIEVCLSTGVLYAIIMGAALPQKRCTTRHSVAQTLRCCRLQKQNKKIVIINSLSALLGFFRRAWQ